MRYIAAGIGKDLARKMVFVGGPRQCGKTTLAKALLQACDRRSRLYLNWDDEEHRATILARQWRHAERLIVFDELYKFARWKNWLKGVYDTRPTQQHLLITGSARLDVYRRGGDSLMGRYYYWRLHPFCLGELPAGMSPEVGLRRLLQFGGFPEPFLAADADDARRWRQQRHVKVIKDDIRDLEPLRNLGALQLFVEALRRRVGSLIVLANLAQDLQVSAKTLSHWLEVLERMYLVFVVRPYTRHLPRAIQKPFKVYFYDNMDVLGDDGARFENLVATHLLKRLHYYEDKTGFTYELRYLRDKEQREVDFVVTKDNEVHALVEAQWTEKDVSKALAYYQAKLQPRHCLQIVRTLRRSFDTAHVQVQTPAVAFLETFPLA